MSKIKIEDIKQEIAADGWQLVSQEYINLDTEMEFICDEGHTVFAPWKKIRQKRECPICKNNKFKNIANIVIDKKVKEFRVLALDQATKISGYSIFSDGKLLKYGTFEALANDEIERDHRIKEWLISMIEYWEPDLVGIEGIQYQQNFGVTTFETLARLQGIIMETLYELNIPYKIAPTASWRKHCGVKGKTRVDKKRSMQMLVKEWFDVSVTDDCSDAIGIGKYITETFCPSNQIINWE